jgi:hypothetical protein
VNKGAVWSQAPREMRVVLSEAARVPQAISKHVSCYFVIMIGHGITPYTRDRIRQPVYKRCLMPSVSPDRPSVTSDSVTAHDRSVQIDFDISLVTIDWDENGPKLCIAVHGRHARSMDRLVSQAAAAASHHVGRKNCLFG